MTEPTTPLDYLHIIEALYEDAAQIALLAPGQCWDETTSDEMARFIAEAIRNRLVMIRLEMENRAADLNKKIAGYDIVI